MITEDYVSFETAKLLKEKGFNEFTFSDYNENGIVQFNEVETRVAKGYQRPTLQMACKWLREVHNIHIIVFHYDNSAFPYIWYIFGHNKEKPQKENSYEEAVEVALKYVLENLI